MNPDRPVHSENGKTPTFSDLACVNTVETRTKVVDLAFLANNESARLCGELYVGTWGCIEPLG